MNTIETERLILRPFTPEDFAAVHTYASAKDNVRYMLWGPNDEAATHQFLAETIAKANASPRKDYDYAVTLKETGELIGGCGLYLSGYKLATGMIGYILHRSHWGHGYATELTAAVLRMGFTALRLHRIFMTCDDRNIASYRVMEKNGLRREGYFVKLRYDERFDGEWCSDLHYAILKEEWERRH